MAVADGSPGGTAARWQEDDRVVASSRWAAGGQPGGGSSRQASARCWEDGQAVAVADRWPGRRATARWQDDDQVVAVASGRPGSSGSKQAAGEGPDGGSSRWAERWQQGDGRAARWQT